MNPLHYSIILIKFVCLLKIIVSNQFDDLNIDEIDKNCLNYPNFQMTSILEDCTNSKRNNQRNSQILVKNMTSSTIDNDDHLTNCVQKLLLNIKITNQGVYQKRTHYIVVDHIVDTVSDKKIKILNPYVIKLRQDPVVEQYDLNYEQTVNGEVQELIFNQHNDDNYKGCSLDPTNPTCPLTRINGKTIPYSTGFCCSCNQQKNHQYDRNNEYISTELLNKLQQFRMKASALSAASGESLTSRQGLDGKMVYDADKSVNYQHFVKDGAKRQRRGGQNCDNTTIPEHLSESTHCLQFSNLWYKIYGLEKPKISHKIHLQIFQKSNNHWKSLTGNRIVCLDSKNSYSNNLKNIRMKYGVDELSLDHRPILNYKKQKLLIPELEANDPSEFMIVPNDMITYDGRNCNKIGVGYEAFYKQKKRCDIDRGSCLRNQPLHLYQNDINAGKRGRNGRYFLKYYGQLPDDIIGRNTTGHEKNIKFLYTKTHISYIDLEINADYLSLILPEMAATINEVSIDTTDNEKIRMIAKITNTGLIYGVFRLRLGGCPLRIPACFNNIATKAALIPPQQQHIFDLFIHSRLPLETGFFCTIFVENHHQEVVALRRIRFVENDRCICSWYCKCICYNTDDDLKCHPLSVEAYQSAGYQGSLPVPTKLLRSTKLDQILAKFCYMFLMLILTLLLLGLIKALLGLWSKSINIWGLDFLFGYDDDDEEKRKCPNINCRYRRQELTSSAQFCLNIIFFFIYPLVLVRNLCMTKTTIEKYHCGCNFKTFQYYHEPIGVGTPEEMEEQESAEKVESIVFTETTDDEDHGGNDEIDQKATTQITT